MPPLIHFIKGAGFLNLELPLRLQRGCCVKEQQILDVGAISSRPGAQEIPEKEEVDRISPVIEAIRNEIPGCNHFSGYLAFGCSQDLT